MVEMGGESIYTVLHSCVRAQGGAAPVARSSVQLRKFYAAFPSSRLWGRDRSGVIHPDPASTSGDKLFTNARDTGAPKASGL